MKITIEKNIPIPLKGNSQFLSEDEKSVIQNMQIGDSFIVSKYTLIKRYRDYAKSIGKEFIARKNYTGKTVANFNYRVWFNRTIAPQKAVYKNNLNKVPKGMLTKSKVSGNSVMLDNSVNEGYAISQEIVAIAELKEENRKICEDMEHIKKVLNEELGHSTNGFNRFGKLNVHKDN